MSIYRSMEIPPPRPPEWVRINRTSSVRRDWILRVDIESGMVWRKDGVMLEGDFETLREQGLI